MARTEKPENIEDTYAYRLGRAVALLRRLSGEFGPVQGLDREMVREFLREEDRRRERAMRELGVK